MKKINLAPTAEVVLKMSDMAGDLQRDLRILAVKLQETNDAERVVEAFTLVQHFMSNCRIDLLITRPIREFLKEG